MATAWSRKETLPEGGVGPDSVKEDTLFGIVNGELESTFGEEKTRRTRGIFLEKRLSAQLISMLEKGNHAIKAGWMCRMKKCS